MYHEHDNNKLSIIVKNPQFNVVTTHTPSLIRRDANHCHLKHNRPMQISPEICPNHYYFVKKQSTKYRFSTYSHILIIASYRNLQKSEISDVNRDEKSDVSEIPKCIINLCQRFLYDNEDEMYYLSYVLYLSLTKLQSRVSSKTIVNKLIAHYLIRNKR